MGFTYWPKKAPAETTVAAFQIAYESIGFQVCESREIEAGHDKVAIFVAHGEVKHAALSTNGAPWKSKLGDAEDIEHPLEAIGGKAYGRPFLFLKRPAT
jgi:hypothetical protein